MRIEAGDFRVENCGKSKPGRVGDQGVCRGAIDLACGGNVGHDRSFQSKIVDQRAFAASCDIRSFIASLRYRQGAALQIRQPDQGSHRVEGGPYQGKDGIARGEAWLVEFAEPGVAIAVAAVARTQAGGASCGRAERSEREQRTYFRFRPEPLGDNREVLVVHSMCDRCQTVDSTRRRGRSSGRYDAACELRTARSYPAGSERWSRPRNTPLTSPRAIAHEEFVEPWQLLRQSSEGLPVLKEDSGR